jgi:hypothetical protein
MVPQSGGPTPAEVNVVITLIDRALMMKGSISRLVWKGIFLIWFWARRAAVMQGVGGYFSFDSESILAFSRHGIENLARYDATGLLHRVQHFLTMGAG